MARKGETDENVLAFRAEAVKLKREGRSAQVAIELAAEKFSIEVEDNWKKYPPAYLSNWAKAIDGDGIKIATKAAPDTRASSVENAPRTEVPQRSAKKQRTKGDCPDDLMKLAVQLSATMKSSQAIAAACEQLKYDAKESWTKNPASFISMWRTRLGRVATSPMQDEELQAQDDVPRERQRPSSEQLKLERERVRAETLQSSTRWWERKFRHEAIPVEDVRIGDKIQYYSMDSPCGWVYACVKEMTKVHGQPAFKVFLGPEEYCDLQKLRVVYLRDVKAAQRPTEIFADNSKQARPSVGQPLAIERESSYEEEGEEQQDDCGSQSNCDSQFEEV